MKVHKLLNLYEMSKPKKQGIDSLAFVAPSNKKFVRTYTSVHLPILVKYRDWR